MSVQSEINRITGNISDAYDAVETKGGTLPASLTSDNLAESILSIEGGGGTPEIFWATKDVTTKAEIIAAIQAGKVVCARINTYFVYKCDAYYYAGNLLPYFYSISGFNEVPQLQYAKEGFTIYGYYVNNNDEWIKEDRVIQRETWTFTLSNGQTETRDMCKYTVKN